MRIEFHVYLTFQTAGIITATLLMFIPLAFLLPSSLHCPFVSAPCGFVRARVCVGVHVCMCVCVCMLELQIKPKLSCFDCSVRVPAAQGPSAEEHTHTQTHTSSHSAPFQSLCAPSPLLFLLSGVGNSREN